MLRTAFLVCSSCCLISVSFETPPGSKGGKRNNSSSSNFFPSNLSPIISSSIRQTDLFGTQSNVPEPQDQASDPEFSRGTTPDAVVGPAEAGFGTDRQESPFVYKPDDPVIASVIRGQLIGSNANDPVNSKPFDWSNTEVAGGDDIASLDLLQPEPAWTPAAPIRADVASPTVQPQPNLVLNPSRKLPSDVIDKLRDTCKMRSCKDQSEEAKAKRTEVSRLRADQLADAYGGDLSRAQEEVSYILNRTQLAKSKLFQAAGLSEFANPLDDGLWQGEVLLTYDQVENVVQLAESDAHIPERPSVHFRSKRYGQFFPVYESYKWSMPIAFTINSLSDSQKTIVRNALNEIEQKSCVRFQESSSPSSPYIEYKEYRGKSFCGQSFIGNVRSINPIQLNFDCPTIYGTVIHETLHSLGFEHHHARVDRDEWITIQWQNVDPQKYDLFVVSDIHQFSTYGVPYDYFSVMHYNGYLASVNGQPTMVPKKEPVDYYQKILGSRTGLSSRDAETLRRMYCQPDCQDSNVFCGYWAAKGYCDPSKGDFQFMKDSCRQSCDLC